MTEKLNILLLEDSALDAIVIERELRKSDVLFSLKVVATEDDFLNALKNDSPGLILADYTLPSYDGLSALLAVRGAHANLPFIFVSGTIGEEKAIEAMRCGATDYVLKERLSKLIPAVNRAIGETNERKKRLAAEVGLINSARQWRATFDAIDDVICLLDMEGKILQCNKAMAKFVGKPLPEIIGGTCWELLHGAEEPVTGCPVSLMRKTRKRESIQISVKDKIVKVTVDPVLDENGDISQAVHIISDITEMERSKQELQASEERYRTLFDHNPVQTIIVDKDARIAMYNFREKEGRVPKIGDVMYKDYAAKHQLNMFEELIKCIRSGDQKEFAELQYNERFLHIRISPFSDGAIITSIDLTEIKTLYERLQQSQKMESIGTLAGGIAHDFNNILSAITGFTELALEGVAKGTELEDDLKEVLNAGLRAKDLVSQILTFARQSDEELKPIQLKIQAKEVLKFIKSSIPTNIQIKDEIISDSFIMGSPTHIHQILMNLCTNSFQAMEPDGGILKVSLNDVVMDRTTMGERLGLLAGDYIEIRVSDTGGGIPSQNLGTIFDPYFTTKKIGEGTGLGLAVVHGIVESYGGKITVDSKIGQGTSFAVYLPISKKRTKHVLFEEEVLPTGNEHILFVDDEASIFKLASRMLELLGYTVTSRTSSIEVLELFRSKPEEFDLVITDMAMPNMTGDKLTIELMKIRPDIPVILCTGFSKIITEKTALKIGIRAFLNKPIRKSVMAKTVRKVLDEAKKPHS